MNIIIWSGLAIGFQKQSFADDLLNSCSKKFHKSHKKAPVLEFLFNKIAGLKALLKSDCNTGVFL